MIVRMKDNLVSLDEIKERIGNKITSSQKKSILKRSLIVAGIAVCMLIYFIVLYCLSKNIDILNIEKIMQVTVIFCTAIGIGLLERAYNKENIEILVQGIEVLFFCILNICLIYILKIDSYNIKNNVIYMEIFILFYYVFKTLFLVLKYKNKYRQENSDIKESVKK